MGLRRASNNAQLIRLGPGLGQLAQRTSAFAEESVARRSRPVFGPRERVCLLAYKAASSQSLAELELA